MPSRVPWPFPLHPRIRQDREITCLDGHELGWICEKNPVDWLETGWIPVWYLWLLYISLGLIRSALRLTRRGLAVHTGT
ncbi:hypothetical protein K504DRAFT_135200 [Pleomassaria siparia CBS 279.74]|uniref:Uncharacterized protein n=1 Tax=Pleomassaria siparia CBS 279.74 TaxID=1314801 RepID=A0A6G1KKJ6_9PLEO|nr:hypothetical protein K504DRAFT_135200 [Pleomassaria siparia CBS 279.74]